MIARILAVALLALAGAAHAATGPDVRMQRVDLDIRDTESLQRGARLFVNYCLNCHSAKYMRYNRLTDLGLTEQQIAENLIFTGQFEQADEDVVASYAPSKVGETMQTALRPQDGKAWFGAPPPDLSVVARVRGTQWLYNYLLAYYRDEKSVTGWNNLVFPNVAMPNVLWQLTGTNALVTTEAASRDAAQAVALASPGVVLVEPAHEGKFAVRTLKVESPGTMSQVDYQRAVGDLVNFLDYMGEPAKTTRVRTGIVVLLYLVVLLAAAYWLKRAYWKDLH